MEGGMSIDPKFNERIKALEEAFKNMPDWKLVPGLRYAVWAVLNNPMDFNESSIMTLITPEPHCDYFCGKVFGREQFIIFFIDTWP
jgi:hypothetical protein